MRLPTEIAHVAGLPVDGELLGVRVLVRLVEERGRPVHRDPAPILCRRPARCWGTSGNLESSSEENTHKTQWTDLAGRNTENTVPRSGVLSTVTLPLCASTSVLTINKPNPVPA
jgi:hypothetical protein